MFLRDDHPPVRQGAGQAGPRLGGFAPEYLPVKVENMNQNDVPSIESDLRHAPTLTGRLVRLEQLGPEHLTDLQEASRDGELWNLWYTSVPHPDDMAAEIDRRLSEQRAGRMIPFVTRRLADGKVTGMTTFYGIDQSIPKLFIGYTWNAASTQGTGMNPESKRLLLRHAFEDLACATVRFETHHLNFQSRGAIERLGAHLDGVLRRDRLMPDGTLRDTYTYSILRAEWAPIDHHLAHRVNQRIDR